jgi:hypothetical protein
LIDTLDDNDTPIHRQTFRISNRVLGFVHGNVEIDRALVGIVPCPHDMPRSDELIVEDAIRARIDSAILQRELVIVMGPADSGRRSMLVAALLATGRDAIAVDARMLSTDSVIADRQLRTLARECRLFDRAPLLVGLDALAATDAAPDRLGLVESAFGDTLVLATSTRSTPRRWARPPTVIELPVFSGRDRARMWQRSLPSASEGDADLLATLYPLAPGLIDSVGALAVAEARDQPIRPEHITIGLRRVVDDRLAGLAKRLTITQTWNDLVLPEDQTMAVVELLARIRARRRVYEDWGFARKVGKGLGVTALFCGPPGTGKTMCAGLIAKDLGTEIYQVDLGKIVSKWLGETEKNLGALFDAAEASHAVLLFDEADSLFGKRTAVTSSNDRHANQETNFLLQRIESFTGICILTTNHDPAIDDAFQRRLSVRVRFPLPDEDERARLWRAMIPDGAPIDASLDLAALAKKYSMAGGNIRNAVLRAAFLAADANESIGDLHLRQAAQLEYEGMGKLVG